MCPNMTYINNSTNHLYKPEYHLILILGVLQNAARIVRALFEVALRKGWPIMAGRLLSLSKTIEKRLWGFEHPLRQFPFLQAEIFRKIEARKLTIDRLKEMDPNEIGKPNL